MQQADSCLLSFALTAYFFSHEYVHALHTEIPEDLASDTSFSFVLCQTSTEYTRGCLVGSWRFMCNLPYGYCQCIPEHQLNSTHCAKRKLGPKQAMRNLRTAFNRLLIAM